MKTFSTPSWGKLQKNLLGWVIIDHNDNSDIETSQNCIFNNKNFAGAIDIICDISLPFSTYPKQGMAYSAVHGRRELLTAIEVLMSCLFSSNSN